MAEEMTELQLMFQERINTGTTWTRNDSFEKNGYLVIKDLWDPQELYHPVPEKKGQYSYVDKNPENYRYDEVEKQVEGSTSRYWHPQYRTIHTGIRLKLEEHLGRKLYNTYYYDRFYYPGQKLIRHADRDACEISVTIHVSTNLEDKDADWPIWIKTPDTYTDKKKHSIMIPGENRSVVLKDVKDPIGVMQCLVRIKKYLVKKLNHTIIKSFFIMFSRMDKEHIVHGIKHDEGTTF